MDIKSQIKSLKKSIEEANEIIRNSNKKIKMIQSECPHLDIEVHPYGSAKCKICEKLFDWYCPNSPTLECDYEQEDGSYDEDCCRYCGQPQERK